MKCLAIVCFFSLLVACSGDDTSTLVVNKSDISLAIDTTGELTSSRTIELGPPSVKYAWQQKLSFLIPEGTWVEKGQKIMGFDAQAQIARSRELQNALATERQRLSSQALNNEQEQEQEQEQLKLNLAQAQMELDKAEAKSKNIDNLMAKIEVQKLRLEHEISVLNFNMAAVRQSNRLAQMEIDKEIVASEVARLTAEVKEQISAIESMTVKAPRKGIVVYKMNNRGEKPAEGDQFTPIHKIIELPDLNNLIIETTIAEQNAHRVNIGDSVIIKMDAIPDQTFTGQVKSLGRIVRVKSKEEPRKVFDAVISIEQADADRMRPGMAARLSIVQGVARDSVAIPHHAIIYKEGRAFVRIKALLGETEQAVKIVQRQDGKAIIINGLNNGDEVLL